MSTAAHLLQNPFISHLDDAQAVPTGINFTLLTLILPLQDTHEKSRLGHDRNGLD